MKNTHKEKNIIITLKNARNKEANITYQT